ncbi:2-alkenal reductase [Bradyrhizobium sp. STM 3843]|uniref:amidase n=1 Tax=Bradyrhizobium sp. STM 3843 TaxID=551947 RepID=UPI0002406C44|nr:amidase [Bradyrhizobium sp. STM 3843]CCE06230.1 2-alkenal reductase [Bradyrhizobium sp. STM 3843]
MNHASGTQRQALASNGMRLNELSARTIVDAIRGRRLTAISVMEACLERIAIREPEVKAWSFLDADAARQRARLADEYQASGLPLGPLHGLPVGVKDVFDTSNMPSEYGSQSLRGRRPTEDADAVSLLHRAGAVVVGKTSTSEFGMYHPSPTHNPLDLSRSPGVSSAGSAAAVVDRMVPLALGTQHTASTTLPASFCGAFAFKPSFGFASMQGSNVLVPRMAHIGLLARSLDDLTLFAGAFDHSLADVEVLRHPPRLGLVRGPGWDSVSPDARQALDRLVAGLPVAVVNVDLPSEFDMALEVVLGLLNAHLANRFGALPEQTFRSFCPPLQEGIVAGRSLSAARYLELEAMADRLSALAAALLCDHDALLTLSAPGEATRLEEGPGSGVLSMPWSLCGLPTVSLPLLRGMNDMPIGVQLVGRHGGDRELLGVAAWLTDVVTLDGKSSHEQI